ncbi:MAG: HAD family hydrolase [Ruminococcus sp.]
MRIRCVALDLDRTTLNKEGKLGQANQRALEELIQKGICVVIASGRSFHTLPSDVMKIQGIQYAVTSNGAAVYRVTDRECIKRYTLKKEAVTAVMKSLEGEDVAYEAFLDGYAYADRTFIEDPVRYGTSLKGVEYIRKTRKASQDIVKFIYENANRLESMDVVVPDRNRKEYLWKKIQKSAPDVYITSSVEQLIELSDRQAGKHSGLRFVTGLLHIPPEEVAAFGDGDNDVDMLKFAGYGIAMENASEKCRQAANYITKHHDKDGVAYGLREILKCLPSE